MRRVLPLLFLLAACGGGSDKAAEPACKLPSADPSATLPPNLPAIDGAVLYEPSTQGKTHIVYAYLPTSDFLKVRDDYVVKLKAAGWRIDGTDQESVEAEVQFSKSPPLVAGTLKVAPLCKGHVSVRFKESL